MASTTPVLRVLTAILALLVASLAPRAHANPQAKPEVSFKVGEAERRAIVVNAPAAGEKRPAVIVLHGGMGSAEVMRASSGFDPVARKNGFIAVYAEGTAFGTIEGRHAWNTGHLLRRQVRDADDIAYLDALIDRLIADHGADPARIFMTGGSNGGMMTFVYAVKRPERLAAVAPVVASMFSFDAVPKVPLPILIINGAKDEEVPLAGGMSGNALVRGAQATPFKPVREVVDFWVKANKSKSDGVTKTEGSVTTTTYAAGEGGAVTEFVVDSAGGHGWPGARARRDGNTPIMAFRGAERVWEFFAGKSRATPPAAAAAEPRKVEIIEFPNLVDPARNRKVPITVHAPSSGGPFPVIVVSHGAGGDRDTHFGQAQDLASHGYVVLCVEHVGSNRERLKAGGLRIMKTVEAMTRDSGEVLARPRDISFALDRATEWYVSHGKLKGKLDLARIGVMGHSFGAYTTMAVCGMRPALDWLTPRVEPGKGLGPDLHDARIRCGVALSPQSPGEPFFLAESFATLQVPLLGISGSKDTQQAGRTPAERNDAFALWPKGGHVFVWLSNAQHNDFTSSSGTTGASLPSTTRDEVQPIVRAATRAFLDLHLKSDASAAKTLSFEALKPMLHGAIDGVEVLTK
jgi:polyhydroxybutyrate depolymerase